MDESYHHVSVLPRELMEGLAMQDGGLYLDATVGGGGHSELVLAHPNTRVIALDRDQDALAASKVRLQERYGDRIQFWQGNFADYNPGNQKFHGIFADLGVSSAQLDQPERGFSFRHEAALDMRMDQTYPRTAADLINRSKEKELADIFFFYGVADVSSLCLIW